MSDFQLPEEAATGTLAVSGGSQPCPPPLQTHQGSIVMPAAKSC